MRRKFYLAFILSMGIVSAVSCGSEGGASIIPDAPVKGEEEETPSEGALKKNAPYKIGAAVNVNLLRTNTTYMNTVINEFSSITAENAMKMRNIWTGEDEFDFTDCDFLVNFAENNGLRVHGHCLIWFKNPPDWLITKYGDEDDPEVWKGLMQKYISTVVGRYKGRIASWDVVNESVSNSDKTPYFRVNESNEDNNDIWYEKIGEDYIKLAFQYAREADPDCLLFYNDYGMEWNNFKHDNILDLVNRLVEEGAEIDGIGLQTHTDVSRNVSHIENAIRDAGNTGLMVHVSEMDVDLFVDDYTGPVTQELLQQQSDRFAAASRALLNLPSNKIFGLTIWGVSDNQALTSEGDQYSLLFDENYQPKLAYYGIASTFPSESEE